MAKMIMTPAQALEAYKNRIHEKTRPFFKEINKQIAESFYNGKCTITLDDCDDGIIAYLTSELESSGWDVTVKKESTNRNTTCSIFVITQKERE